MATVPHSTLLFDNVNKLLTTFIPAHSRRDSNQLYTSIGVKSHGTITCTKKKKAILSLFYFFFLFLKFPIINPIEQNLFVYHLTHRLYMLKNYLLDYGVME